MLLDALTAGEKLQIRVEKGTNTTNFSTEVIRVTSEVDQLTIQQYERKLHTKILPVKLITDPKTGSPISFPEENIIYKVYAVRDKVPYLWRRITIRRIEKAAFHILLSNEDAQPAERRSDPRITLNLPGSARFLGSTTPVPITVKNISGSGIGIVVDPGTAVSSVKAGSLIQDVSFTDPELNLSFQLIAFVQRTTKYTNGRTLYGCKLNSKTLEISNFVNQKRYLKQTQSGGLSIEE